MPARRTEPRQSTPPRVRLRSPSEIVASVPYLLGFHPHDSVVLIGLTGQPKTVCLTVRIDLPAQQDRRPVAQHLAAHLAHAGAVEVILVVAADTAAETSGDEALVALIREEMGPRGLRLVDALWIRSGRWGSFLCSQPSCCPPEGTPIDPAAAVELAAVSVVLGDVVHASREHLEATLRAVDGPDRVALDRTFEWVSRQLVAELAERGWEAVAEDSVGLLANAVADRVEGGCDLAPADVARLALGLGDVRVRDRVLAWADGELASAAEGLWVELVRRATSPYDAAPATLLAVHAYLRGNGAYARIALDRALASDPGYSLAGLLAEGLERGVAPSALRAALIESQAA